MVTIKGLHVDEHKGGRTKRLEGVVGGCGGCSLELFIKFHSVALKELG